MPEGHTIHRTAELHSKQLVGKMLRTSSPQGRFADEARKLDRCKLQRIEAHGKHLFYHWRKFILHVHLGLYGKFRNHKSPFPEPRGAVRLRMLGKERGFDLVGPNRCELLDESDYQKIRNRLGQDPLRDDADPEIAWNRTSRSRSAIGKLLLDQSIYAGVGNIYRADVLFHVGLHPETEGRAVTREKFDEIWEFLLRTMAVGKRYNRIINTLPDDVGKPYSRMNRTERLLVYKKSHCIECDGPIESWLLGSRTVYACTNCQEKGALVTS